MLVLFNYPTERTGHPTHCVKEASMLNSPKDIKFGENLKLQDKKKAIQLPGQPHST
jgi:hypothetical protein